MITLDSKIKVMNPSIGKIPARKLIGQGIYTFRDLKESGHSMKSLRGITGIGKKSAEKLISKLRTLRR